MLAFTVTEAEAGARVDRFAEKCRPDLSRAAIAKGIRTKRIKRNGKRTEGSERLSAGDVLSIYLADAMPRETAKSVRVVYEDARILIVQKEAGLLCQDLAHPEADTLAARVDAMRKAAGAAPCFLCHRLDFHTSGLVLFAKDTETLALVEEAIRAHRVVKRYLAVALGRVTPREATLSHQLFKDAKKGRVYVSDGPTKGSKTAILHYRVLAMRGDLSLVECELVTGRTHQIRAQMAAAGFPLLGDAKYGSKQESRAYKESHQLLCAYQIKFETDPAGPLGALSGKTVTLSDVPFREKYFAK